MGPRAPFVVHTRPGLGSPARVKRQGKGSQVNRSYAVIFTKTTLPGAYLIEPERLEDARGFFARTWCQQEFAAQGLNSHLVQCNLSYNHRRGTLRGMHLQIAPHPEAKVVRCTRGALYDVIIDLRPHSPTFTQWIAATLTADNRHMLYVPAGCAHGFQTLVDETEVFYQMSACYHPDSARGVRWDDPTFGVAWPIPNPVMSERDRTYPDFREAHWLSASA